MVTHDRRRVMPTSNDFFISALLAPLARDVFPVVRDSRMWCPHDIGRDSWVWGEQEPLYI